MKTCVRIIIVLTVLAMGVSARAQTQTCTSTVAGWTGQYSLSDSGAGTDVRGISWTANESATNVGVIAVGGATSCTTAEWSLGGPAPATVSVTDHGQIACPSGGTQTTDITGMTLSDSLVDIKVDSSTGMYSLVLEPTADATFVIAGCGNPGSGNITVAIYPYNWLVGAPPTFPLPSTPQSLTGNMSNFQAIWTTGQIPMTWNFSFTLDPVYNDDSDCKQQGAGAPTDLPEELDLGGALAGVPVSSSIGCQNQSLGEDVPIVGTGFHLHYESGRASGAAPNSIANSDASMLGGWTLSVHHAYDGSTLFLGNGRQRNAYQLGAPVVFNGNFLLTSEGGSEVYVFSGSTGQHLQTVRPLTGALLYQFGYDAAGKLVTVTDANGNVTTIQRDATEHPTAIVSPYGQTTTLSVDSNGFLNQVTDPFGKSATFTNSSTGLLASRTDENGNLFNYTYDAQGRLTKDADSLGGSTALTRTKAASGFGWAVGETTSMGRTSSYQTSLNVPWVQTSTSTFSKQHTNTWPNGLQATGTKTQQGSQISGSVTLPDGTSNSDTLGPDPIWGIQVPVATSQTLTKGNLTMNISRSRTASLGTAGNPFSLLSRTDTRTINGRTYTSAFTASNRAIVDSSPMGRKRTTVLDNQERISRIQIEGLLASNFGYDLRGRLLAVTEGTRKRTFTYDSNGRLATATDPLGLKKSFIYDADGRLLSTTLADGRIIGYQYDANGNLTAVTPPGKSAHAYAYTAVNLVSGYQPPSVAGAGSTTYSYNTDRDLTQITRPDSKTISFGYDTAGRLSSVTTPSETIDYTYDSTTGNLTAASITGGEALSYGYSGPLPTSSSWTGTVNGSVGLAYNNNFWTTSQSINGGNTIAFSHDNDGLVTNAGALTLNRSPLNRQITGTTLGPASDSRTYNSFGELTGYTASYNGVGLYNVSYTRDAGGRVSRETESIGGHTNTYAYSYDLAGRLVGVSQNGAPVSSYSYDSNSNRLQATTSSGTVSATYDAQDRLLTHGPATYTYTANGELASQTVGTQTTTYQYDVLGNLVSVTLPNGTAISYVVDAQNRRVGKKVNGVLVAGFLYDDDRIVAQLNGSNAIVSQFIYASRTTSPDYIVSGGVTYRMFSDQLGSPRVVVNTSTGAIAEQITYDEFGNVLSDSNPGFQPFGFAGGLHDQDTKLVRLGTRDYDPKTGRWTAKDRIRFASGDTNLYAYALNDPMNGIDPTGLGYLDINISVGSGVGITFGVQIGFGGQGWFPYLGGGLMTGSGVSVTVSPQDPSIGPQLQGSVGAGVVVNGGVSTGANQGDPSSGFVEIGVTPSPGASLTGAYVFPPWRESNDAWVKRVLCDPNSGRNAPNPFDRQQSNPGYPGY